MRSFIEAWNYDLTVHSVTKCKSLVGAMSLPSKRCDDGCDRGLRRRFKDVTTETLGKMIMMMMMVTDTE